MATKKGVKMTIILYKQEGDKLIDLNAHVGKALAKELAGIITNKGIQAQIFTEPTDVEEK